MTRPLAERAAFLDTACAGDAALRARIESLLCVPDEVPDFMDASSARIPLPIDAHAGDMIDRYKLLQKIGEAASESSSWPSRRNLSGAGSP